MRTITLTQAALDELRKSQAHICYDHDHKEQLGVSLPNCTPRHMLDVLQVFLSTGVSIPGDYAEVRPGVWLPKPPTLESVLGAERYREYLRMFAPGSKIHGIPVETLTIEDLRVLVAKSF